MRKVLVLGVTGMLGNLFFRKSLTNNEINILGTARSDKDKLSKFFSHEELSHIKTGINAYDIASIEKVVSDFNPSVIVNCIGIIKQQSLAKSPIPSLSLNSLFPHQIAELSTKYNARLIHISTDCVFNGSTGNYKENDISNAEDLYGRTKYLGEVNYGEHVTIRTSIIGHEIETKIGLLEWFLAQKNEVNGFTNAIYTGFTVNELTDIIHKYFLFDNKIKGLVQVSSDKINKYELLKIIAEVYKKNIKIIPFSDFVLDRSLDSSYFKTITNYSPTKWEQMIKNMNNNNKITNHELRPLKN